MDKDERSLFEAMLHRLQIIRQESEQQTALLRQLCQAFDSLGTELARLNTATGNRDADGQSALPRDMGRVPLSPAQDLARSSALRRRPPS